MKILQKKSGKLIEIKSISGRKFGDYEKIIQSLIETNLSVVFPRLEFIKSEHQINKLRIDTVAFDQESKSFVIFEYKNVKHRGVVDQGLAYYRLLMQNKAEFVILYQKQKGILYDVDEINWDEAQVIFISPEYTIHQIMSSQSLPLPIELYEIKKYENELITLNKIEHEDNPSRSNSHELKTKKSKNTHRNVGQNFTVLQDYSEDDYLNGAYHPMLKLPEKQKKLFIDMKNLILEIFPQVEYKQRKLYGGFYSKSDGSAICTLEATKSKLKLIYSTTKKNLLPKNIFVEDVSNKGKWGIGNFRSEIKNESDIKKSIDFIRYVYDDKIK